MKGQLGVRVDNPENYKKFQLYLKQEGESMQDLFNNVINEIALKYDGMSNGLDKFLDPDFVQTPKITDEFEKMVEYLKTIKDDSKLSSLRDQFYRIHIMTKALLETPPNQRLAFNMNYVTAWQKYR